jgi:hypothetical protein
MRIKTVKPVIISGYSNTRPVPVGTVLDSEGDQTTDMEYKALVKAGRAKETKEAVGEPKPRNLAKLATGKPATSRRAVTATFDPAAEHADDAFFNDALAGTVDDVKANLDGLDDNALARMEYLEGQREKGPRQGALDAIGKARASLAEGAGE